MAQMTLRLALRRKRRQDDCRPIFGTDGQTRTQSGPVPGIRASARNESPTGLGRKRSTRPIAGWRKTAQFRDYKDKVVLRVPEADGKEREYRSFNDPSIGCLRASVSWRPRGETRRISKPDRGQ